MMFMPMFSPAIDAAGFSSLAFVDSATSTASTITIPAGASIGDVAVLFDYAYRGGSPPTLVTPTDWTSIGEDNQTTARINMSYKILGTGEPGSSITGMNGATSNNKVMFVFSGSISSITPGGVNVEATSGNPASQSCTAASGTAPLVVCACCGTTGGGMDFTTESPALTSKVLGGFLRAGYIIYNSSQANHTFDMADEGSRNVLGSFYLQAA